MNRASLLFLALLPLSASADDFSIPVPTLAVVPDKVAKVSGAADVGVLIDQAGNVRKAVMINTAFPRGVNKAVLQAARLWRFDGAKRGCAWVPSSIALRFTFNVLEPKAAWGTGTLLNVVDPLDKMPKWLDTSAEIKEATESVKAAKAAWPDNQGDNPTQLCLIDAKAPNYPKTAENDGLEGATMTRVKVAPDGRVLDAEVLQSYPRADFGATSLRSVKEWRFQADPQRPADGEWACLPMTFSFDRGVHAKRQERMQAACDAPKASTPGA